MGKKLKNKKSKVKVAGKPKKAVAKASAKKLTVIAKPSGKAAKVAKPAAIAKLFLAKVVYTPHGGSLHDMFGYLGNLIYRRMEQLLFLLTDSGFFSSK